MRVTLARRGAIASFFAAVATSTNTPFMPSVIQVRPQAACATVEELSKKTVKLADGAELPLIGLGTWESSKGEVEAAVSAALNAGYRHFDCAPVYRNEHEVGRALAHGSVPRSELWITSKLWNDRRRPADVREALEQTLASLQTDYLDLYLIHWPVVWARNTVMKPDSLASLAECWRTLEALVDEGKVRHIGVSNFGEAELAALLSAARIKPAVNQIELHPRLPQTALVEYCQRNGIVVTAYSPLGRGTLKGANMLSSPTVQELAARHAVSPAAVLLRWNLQRGVVVIPKSTNPGRLAANLEEPWRFALSADEVRRLEDAVAPGRFCSPPWATFDDQTTSQRLLGTALTQVARVVFSVAWLDVTKW